MIKIKKAELSLTVIVVAVICLIVLIVVLAIFYTQTGGVANALSKIGKDAGDKAENAQRNLDDYFTCNEGQTKCVGNKVATCRNEEWSPAEECQSGQTCKGDKCA